MTVSELKELLNEIPDEREILFCPDNSDYVEDIRDIKRKFVRSMWGNDFEAFVIRSDGQTGSI